MELIKNMDKTELCKICLLNKHCQKNFDYECIQAFDHINHYTLNRWELKVLAINCEIALSLNNNDLDDDPNLDQMYLTIDDIIEHLNMSTYESAVFNDHITLLRAFLGLANKNQVFESAFQFYYLYENRLNTLF